MRHLRLQTLLSLILAVLLIQPLSGQDEDNILDGLNPIGNGNQDASRGDGLTDDPFGGNGNQPQGPSEEDVARMRQLNQSGIAKVEQGDSAGAILDFEEAIQTVRNFESYFELGRLQRELGEPEVANQYLQMAISLQTQVEDSSLVAKAYQELGQSYLDSESYNLAMMAFQQGLTVPGQSRNAELMFGLALAQTEFAIEQQFTPAQQKQEDLQNALTTFDRAIAIKPDYAEALFERGSTHLMLGQLEEATDDLKKAVQIEGSNPEYVAQLGFAHLRGASLEASKRLGQRAKIIDEYQSAVNQFTQYFVLVPEELTDEEQEETDVRRESVFLNRASAHQGLGDETQGDSSFHYRNAVADCDAAIEIEPQLTEAFFQKGISLRMLGDFNGAIDAYTEALETRPNYADAILRRGIVFFRLGDYEMAHADFTAAKRYSGPNPVLSFWSGLVYSKRGEPRRAIEEYSAALTYQPFFSMAYFNRGLALMKIGRFNRAVNDFNEVMRREPKNTQARSLRDQAKQLMRTSS